LGLETRFNHKRLNLVKGHYEIFELEELPADQLYAVARGKIHPDDRSIVKLIKS
jgi:hypothetical protein